MGAAGSDVAMETADVALMADDLAHLPFAVGLNSTPSFQLNRVSDALAVKGTMVPTGWPPQLARAAVQATRAV